MSLQGFEPWTPASLRHFHERCNSSELQSYKSGALTRLSYRLTLLIFKNKTYLKAFVGRRNIKELRFSVYQNIMKITLTKHAQKRMSERNIKIEDIKNTIEMPDYTIIKNGKIESYKKINEKTLKIVYLKGTKFIKIITLIWK